MHRIKSLVNDGINPNEILALTFTNRSSAVMMNRLQLMKVDGVCTTTFHSLGVRILRKYVHDKLIIYDEVNSLDVIKELLKAKKIPIDSAKDISSYIQNRKDLMIRSADDKGDYSDIYRDYQIEMARRNAFDFGDLISSSAIILNDKGKDYPDQWKHILVDEVQDTSLAQFEMLKGLRGNTRRIFMVGDSDQAIYSWRGARPENIIDFIDEYKPSIINMGINYRSTCNIVKYASNLIKLNDNRIGKDLTSHREDGEIPEYTLLDNTFEEAQAVVDLAVKQERYSDLAVLYRCNWMSGVVEMKLNEHGIPYNMKDDVGFFGRAEIKDALAYLRVVYNHNDTSAIRRALKSPRRGLGDVKLSQVNVLDDLKTIKLNKKQNDNSKKFIDLIEKCSKSKDLKDIIKCLAEETDNFGHKDDERVKNIRELSQLVGDKSLDDFILQVTLKDVKEEDNDKGVNLMTLHSSKGMEFKTVAIIGCEQGILPSVRNRNTEEERRLMYVGMTRARNSLHLFGANIRSVFGNLTSSYPSQFIKEAGLA